MNSFVRKRRSVLCNVGTTGTPENGAIALPVPVTQKSGEIVFVLDARKALGGFRGRRVRLAFSGVRRRIPTRGLVGDWWVYEEVHPSGRAPFALHVLLQDNEFEIEAESLDIKLLPR